MVDDTLASIGRQATAIQIPLSRIRTLAFAMDRIIDDVPPDTDPHAREALNRLIDLVALTSTLAEEVADALEDIERAASRLSREMG